MNSSTRVEDVSQAPAQDQRLSKSGLLFRTLLFISIHLAFVGAVVLLNSG